MAWVGPWNPENEHHYVCASTDTKPTAGMKPGDRCWVTDEKKWYIYSGSAWVAMS